MIFKGNVADEEWNEHLMNGEAFCSIGLQGGAVGMIAHVQLFNPVGSGVRVRLRTLETLPIFFIAINTNIRRHDVALTTNAPFAGPTNLLGSGGAAALAETRTDSLVAAPGSPFWLILSTANTRKDYPALQLEWGHDLLEGQGIVLQSGVGGFIFTGFMWVEVPL